MISDATARLCAARLLPDEAPESFQKGLERAWIRSFGPMRILQVDEHRSWASGHIKTWTGNHSIQLMISPGQVHERLAVIERRHQGIRRAVALFLLESNEYSPEGIINALNYVIPQVNRLPNMQGDSPLQWTLRYNPHVPGLLIEEELNPTQLHPTEAFQTSTLFRQDLVNRQKPGPKISWKGPAAVVMVEHEPHEVLWLVHGTTMLRAAPEHVKPVISPDPSTSTITIEEPLQRAQLSLQQIRNRGVTQYVDLSKSKQKSPRRSGDRG